MRVFAGVRLFEDQKDALRHAMRTEAYEVKVQNS